jgi:hypothetical protein
MRRVEPGQRVGDTWTRRGYWNEGDRADESFFITDSLPVMLVRPPQPPRPRQTPRWTRHHPHSLKFHRVAAIEFLVLRRQLRELVDHDDETGRAGKIGVDCVVDAVWSGAEDWYR